MAADTPPVLTVPCRAPGYRRARRPLRAGLGIALAVVLSGTAAPLQAEAAPQPPAVRQAWAHATPPVTLSQAPVAPVRAGPGARDRVGAGGAPGTGETPPLPETSLFAAALAARLAQTGDSPILAAQAYERVWQASPGDPALLRRAVDGWLEAGDVAAALRLARSLAPSDRSAAAALVLATQAVERRRWHEVGPILEGPAFDSAEAVLAGALRAGSAAARRDWAGALVPTEGVVGTRGLDRAVIAGRGLVLEQAGRGEDALVAYTTAWNSGLRTVGLAWLKGRAEAAAGRFDLAAQTVAGGIAANGRTPPLVALASGVTARRVPRLPDRSRTAAWSLFLIGESLAGDARGASPVPALALALALEPRLDEARVPLAAWLVARGRVEEALARLAEVGPASPYRIDAAVARAWLLQRAGRSAEAMSVVDLAQRGRGDPRLTETRAYFDLAAGLYQPALEGFSALIAAAATPDGARDPRQVAQLHYNRAVALEGLDRWEAAEADFRQALVLDPRNPTLLNGLGYGLADRGLKLDEALRLLRQAARLDPRNGAILDSLGWALFRSGDYAAAVVQLERAAALMPASAEVLDHLGDAYWRLGRLQDARIEWRKALGLDVDAARRTTLEAKLQAGLPAEATPLPVAGTDRPAAVARQTVPGGGGS